LRIWRRHAHWRFAGDQNDTAAITGSGGKAGWGLFGLIIGGSFDQFGLIVLGLLPACVTAVMLALLMNRVRSSEIQGG